MRSDWIDGPVLVTGAGGGLGTALIRALEADGCQYILCPTRQELDLTDQKAVLNYFSEKKPKVVLHLASIVFGLQGNINNQMLSLIQNTQINNNLFFAIDCYPVEYIFFAGTVASYAYPYNEMPLKEEHFFSGLPHSGEFGYAMSKRHAYSYLNLLQKTKKVDFTYGILTNLYGEDDRFNPITGHVIPSLINKAFHASRDNNALEVWGDGYAERDFLHFADAANAILLCMKSKVTLVNISSGISVSIRQLTHIIAEVAGLDEVKFLADKPVGIQTRVVSNKQLIEQGFVQAISLDKGIKDLYHWFCENVDRIRI